MSFVHITSKSSMQNNRPDLMSAKFPYVIQIKQRVERDLESACRLRKILSPTIWQDKLSQSFNGTYRGNVFKVIQNSIANELILTVSRLFHKPSKTVDKINLDASDRSLVLLAELIQNPDVRQSKARDEFRWGAVQTPWSALSFDGVPMKGNEIRERIASGRRRREDSISVLSAVTKEIFEFSESKEYGRLKTFRTEQIAHSLANSRDAQRWNLLPEERQITFDGLFQISEQAIILGEKAIAAIFGCHISISDHEEIWEQYSGLFWSQHCDFGFKADLHENSDEVF